MVKSRVHPRLQIVLCCHILSMGGAYQLERVFISLAWPDLSSMQGVITFSVSALFGVGAYRLLKAITPCLEEGALSGYMTLFVYTSQ